MVCWRLINVLQKSEPDSTISDAQSPSITERVNAAREAVNKMKTSFLTSAAKMSGNEMKFKISKNEIELSHISRCSQSHFYYNYY